MPQNQNNHFINDLLNLMVNPVHRRRHQNRVRTSNGSRMIGEMIDETGIGNQNETDNLIVQDTYILDCGHTSRDNLGGQCHYCDNLICDRCIFICSSCGHSLCPQHTVMANFEGYLKPYCRSCTEEITRNLKLRRAAAMIVSVFVSREDRS